MYSNQNTDQLGTIAKPARGQLNKENGYFPVPFAPEKLSSRDRFGRPVLRQSAHSSHSGRV